MQKQITIRGRNLKPGIFWEQVSWCGGGGGSLVFCGSVFLSFWMSSFSQVGSSQKACCHSTLCFMLPRKRLSGGCMNVKLMALGLFFRMTLRTCIFMLHCSVTPWCFQNILVPFWDLDCLPLKNSLKTQCETWQMLSQLMWSHKTCSASFCISVLWISAFEKHKSVTLLLLLLLFLICWEWNLSPF